MVLKSLTVVGLELCVVAPAARWRMWLDYWRRTPLKALRQTLLGLTPSRAPEWRSPVSWSSPNTVQLGCSDGCEWWSGGLGPVVVSVAFDVPLGHLALDEPWIGSEPAAWVEPATESGDGVLAGVVSLLRGENRGPW